MIIKEFSSKYGVVHVFIENDELWKQFEAYDGLNSLLFKRPAVILVEAIHDRALKRLVSFVLDSTISNHDKAASNIQRSLDTELLRSDDFCSPRF
ncbi:MAG: hypothetical protein DSY85_09910 [Marinomonas sp.]|nr:MAG: hypothetical protein DSY85_09910 [Marinomonas sp.]